MGRKKKSQPASLFAGMEDDIFGSAAASPEPEQPPEQPKQEVQEIPQDAQPQEAVPELPATPVTEWEWTPGEPIVFDIETGPEPEDVLREYFEWDPSTCEAFKLLGAVFDPATVKTGNLGPRDGPKAQAKIAEKKTEFETAVANAERDIEAARKKAWQDFCEAAPLSPIYGRILAIGYGQAGKVKLSHTGSDEVELLREFWQVFDFATRNRCRRIIGFNSDEFDLAFIVRRSWKQGVDVPAHWKPGRYLNDIFTDLMKVWAAGKWGDRIKLDKVCQFLGLSRKTGDGAMFHRLYNGNPEERQQALEYLANDIQMTAELANRIL